MDKMEVRLKLGKRRLQERGPGQDREEVKAAIQDGSTQLCEAM